MRWEGEAIKQTHKVVVQKGELVKYMHRTVNHKGFVVLAAVPWLITVLLALSAISICFYRGTELISYHDQLLSMYAFLEEDFSRVGKEGQDLQVVLPEKFARLESRQKIGPYFLLQKTIFHTNTGKTLLNRMEFVSATEGTQDDP